MPAKQYTLTARNSTPPELGDDDRDRYELFYGYVRGIDGHGGPYYDLGEAQSAAATKLAGCASMAYIEIRRETADGFTKLIQTLRKSEAHE